MYRSNSNRIIPIILVIAVMVALIAGLIAVGRYLFFGQRANTDEANVQQQARDELLTVTANRSVRMTLRGPIVAEENFRTQQITISPSSRNYAVYRGYLEKQISNKRYSNNNQAYDQFVNALDKADMTIEGKDDSEEAPDLRGICATGRVYQYEILDNNSVVDRYWTSTCKGSQGTFGASVTQVNNLFIAQIPDKIDLGGRRSVSLDSL